jgi:hypothetical protein
MGDGRRGVVGGGRDDLVGNWVDNGANDRVDSPRHIMDYLCRRDLVMVGGGGTWFGRSGNGDDLNLLSITI